FLVVVISLVGCGPSEKPAPKAEAPAVSAPAPGKPAESKNQPPASAAKPAASAPAAAVPAASAPRAASASKEDHNMYAWRGPLQSVASLEHYANGKLDPNPVWRRDTHGRGTAVIVDGKVFTFGYRGAREELIEHLACLAAKTGKQFCQ